MRELRKPNAKEQKVIDHLVEMYRETPGRETVWVSWGDVMHTYGLDAEDVAGADLYGGLDTRQDPGAGYRGTPGWRPHKVWSGIGPGHPAVADIDAEKVKRIEQAAADELRERLWKFTRPAEIAGLDPQTVILIEILETLQAIERKP